MSTLNHECFANATTPLWASASGSGGNTKSPFNVVNTPTATTQTTIFDTNVTSGMFFAPLGGSETQAYGEVQFDITPAVHLKTNGKEMFTITPSNITANATMTIGNPQSTLSNQITTNSIGNPRNADATIQFGNDYVNLGTTAYVGSGDGLVVYNGGFSNYSEVQPTTITFGTSTQTPSSTTENFSTATIGVLGWTSQTGIPFDGYIWSCDNPNGDAQGGLTLTNPASSVKAVTNTNAPSSGKSAWMGGFLGTAGGQYTSYLEFPTISAPVGTQVSVTWKQAGSVFSLNLYKNDVIAIANASNFRPSSTTWSTPSIFPYTFTSTGTDNLYLAVQCPTGGSYTYTPYNIGDIVITIQGQVEHVTGGIVTYAYPGTSIPNQAYFGADDPTGSTAFVGVRGTPDNKVTIQGTDNVDANAYISVAGATSNAGEIQINSANILNLTAPNFTMGGGSGTAIVLNYGTTLNLDSGNIDAIGNVNASQVFADAVYPKSLYAGSGMLNIPVYCDLDLQKFSLSNVLNINNEISGFALTIGNASSEVDIYNGGSILANSLNGNPGGAVIIGGTSACYIENAGFITGVPGSGSALNYFGTTNGGAPLTAGAQLQYVVNWSGNKPNTMYLPPSPNVYGSRNNAIFGNGFTGADYVQSTNVIVPARAIFRVLDVPSGNYLIDVTNTTTYPKNYTFTGFSPSSSNQAYQLVPLCT
jgi:hypothetical protein